MVEWTWCHCKVLWWGDGIITGCYCSVIWLRGRVIPNFGGLDAEPLQGAIVVCCGCGEGNDQLWGSGCGAIAGYRCSVPQNYFLLLYLGSMLV